MNYDEWKLSTPPSKDEETEICISCEYEFDKNNMNFIQNAWICNKCLKQIENNHDT